MMGDQGTDETPQLVRPGSDAGDYDDGYYTPDNDPVVSHTRQRAEPNYLVAPGLHSWPGIAYADPSGAGQHVTFVASGQAGKRLRQVQPVRLGRVFGIDPGQRREYAVDVRHRQSRHGGGVPATMATAAIWPGWTSRTMARHLSVCVFVPGTAMLQCCRWTRMTSAMRSSSNTGYSGGAQNSWVERTLAAHRADPNIDFIVCFFHHCAYSTTGAHASDGGLRAAGARCSTAIRSIWCCRATTTCSSAPTRPGRSTDDGRRRPRHRISGDRRHRLLHRRLRRSAALRVLPGERESYRGNEIPDTFVPDSYVWTAGGGKQTEAVGWSRVRYRNYAFIRVDVGPGQPDQ